MNKLRRSSDGWRAEPYMAIRNEPWYERYVNFLFLGLAVFGLVVTLVGGLVTFALLIGEIF